MTDWLERHPAFTFLLIVASLVAFLSGIVFGVMAIFGLDDKSGLQKHCDEIQWTYLHDGSGRAYCIDPKVAFK